MSARMSEGRCSQPDKRSESAASCMIRRGSMNKRREVQCSCKLSTSAPHFRMAARTVAVTPTIVQMAMQTPNAKTIHPQSLTPAAPLLVATSGLSRLVAMCTGEMVIGSTRTPLVAAGIANDEPTHAPGPRVLRRMLFVILSAAALAPARINHLPLPIWLSSRAVPIRSECPTGGQPSVR